jgi:hypothetical protein
MSPANGFITGKSGAIALLILLMPFCDAKCQESILDSTFTFRAGTVKTGNALNIITKETGFYFTYDSRLIDTEKKTELTFKNVRLKVILDSLLKADSLTYSVLDEFIIISRQKPPPPVNTADKSFPGNITFITGIITDGESGDPLPFATIGLKNAGKGTVSNANGEFRLNIFPENYNDTLRVSYLGYYARSIPVRQSFGNNFRIAMVREFISIPEIIIRNQIPQEIIRKSLSSRAKNYGNTPANLTAFYREGVLKKDELQSYSEAVLEIYKSGYAGSLLNDQIKVYKSRKIENISTSDSIAIRLKAGLGTCLQLDGVRNGFDFLEFRNMGEYTYRMVDIVSYDEESAYEIEFTPKESDELSMFSGSVFINTSDFAILSAEFEINPSYLHKMKGSFISSPSRDYTTWPVSVKYSVSYRKLNGRYFLSHVRGDLGFSSRRKRRLFNTQFSVFFEMAVTDIKLNNVIRFERDELAPIRSVFSRTIKEYDPVFWGNQDFLKPEDDLLRALKNMKVKLQEFSDEE